MIRGVALFGVLLANLVFAFRISPTGWYLPEDPYKGLADAVLEAALVFVVQGKAIALFSMLFGVGLAIQHQRFARLGNPRYWLLRRLVVLFAIGVAHLLLVFNGDIVHAYALSGLVILPLLGASTRTVALAAAACLLLYLTFAWLPFAPQWPDTEALKREYFEAMRIYGGGSFAEIRRYSWHEFRVFLPIYVSLFPLTPAYLLFGVLAWRCGVLREPAAHRTWLKPFAIAATLLGAFMSALSARPNELSYVSAGMAAPVMAAGYGAALLLALQSAGWRRMLRPFAPAGRMAFTNYLVQSVVFAWVFWGYGLGLIGKVGAANALAWGVAFFVLQAASSAWWLRRFHFGPVEWLWRTLTYAAPQPMRRA